MAILFSRERCIEKTELLFQLVIGAKVKIRQQYPEVEEETTDRDI